VSYNGIAIAFNIFKLMRSQINEPMDEETVRFPKQTETTLSALKGNSHKLKITNLKCSPTMADLISQRKEWKAILSSSKMLSSEPNPRNITNLHAFQLVSES
jgi:hypothetical protein